MYLQSDNILMTSSKAMISNTADNGDPCGIPFAIGLVLEEELLILLIIIISCCIQNFYQNKKILKSTFHLESSLSNAFSKSNDSVVT